MYLYADSEASPNTRSAPAEKVLPSWTISPTLAVSSTVGHGRSLPVSVVIVSASLATPPKAFIRSTILFRKPSGTR
jgi:hypothetical protein